MSFPAYPQYSAPSIDYLGELPEHWWAVPLKRLATVRNGRDYKEVEETAGPYPVIGSGGEFARSSAYLYSGESVLFGRKGTVDRPLLVSGSFWTVDTMFYTVVHRNTDPRFLFYTGSIIPFGRISTNTALPSVAQEDLSDTYLPQPPLTEQTVIADFLDHETARIDALIEEQQRLIALLKEELHTSLADSVTKGLDPIAPKRETEISDLPTIPEHWRLTKAKFLIREFEQGWSPQCENTPARDDSDWAVLKVGAVNGGMFRPNENKRLPEELEGISKLTVRAGDLLVSRANTRELVGSAAVVERDHDRLMVSDKLYRIRLNETACIPAFLSAYLQTQHPRREIEFEATGASSSMLNIGQYVVRELLVPTPPIDEQKEIVDWISERQHQYETLMHTANRSIELLRERRHATISAAVTGKIDVRNWVQRMSSDELELPCAAEEGASYG